MSKAEAKAAMALHHRRGISLKAAWAQVRHGVRASPGGTRKTRSAKSSNGSSPKGGRIGRIYQSSTQAIGVLAPVTDAALHKMQDRSSPFLADLKYHAWNANYGKNLLVEGATAMVDKRFGQAAAISRGSVSAIAGEIFLGAKTGLDVKDRLDPRGIHGKFLQRRNAYNPVEDSFDLRDPDFVAYRIVKHGGQVARKLRTRSAEHGGIIARLLEPVGENLLRPLGLTW